MTIRQTLTDTHTEEQHDALSERELFRRSLTETEVEKHSHELKSKRTLTETEVEQQYGSALSKRRLQQWRWLRRGGPSFIRIGDRIFYEVQAIERFLAEHLVVPPPADSRRVD